VTTAKRSFSISSIYPKDNEAKVLNRNFKTNNVFSLQPERLEWNSTGFNEEKTDPEKSIFTSLNSCHLSIDDYYVGSVRSCPEIEKVDINQHQMPTIFNRPQSMMNLSMNNHNILSNSNASPVLTTPNSKIQEQSSPKIMELNALNHNVEHSNAQEQRLARISTSIVWLFILCHVWRMIPTIYECLNSDNGLEVAVWPTALDVIEHISHSLILTNSAINFLIYVFM